MIDALRFKQRCPPLHTVNDIVSRKQKLGEISPVLPRNAGYQRFLFAHNPCLVLQAGADIDDTGVARVPSGTSKHVIISYDTIDRWGAQRGHAKPSVPWPTNAAARMSVKSC